MSLRGSVLAGLMSVGCILGCQSAEAFPPAQDVASGANKCGEGKNNKNAVLESLRPVLRAGNMVARIYYRTAACQAGDVYFVSFPGIRIKSPSKNKIGLAAVRDMFRNDKNVQVMETPPGIIKITIGNVPYAILQTKIHFLSFGDGERYNDYMAIDAIENTSEVRTVMQKLGIREPPIPFIGAEAEPTVGAPHLPASMTDVTVDQALDEVARTFGNIVLYGACDQPRLIHIENYPVVDFIEPTSGGGGGSKSGLH